MQEQDLLGGESRIEFDEQAFPDAFDFDGEELPLSYAYRPGQEEDGLTVAVPYKLVQFVDPEVLEWLVPGLLEEKITILLRSLPKATRKQLIPIPEKAKAIAVELEPTHPTFLDSLQDHLRQHYRVEVQATDWKTEELPDHLRMRIEVQGNDETPLVSGRDLQKLTKSLEQHDTPAELDAWKEATRKWEREGLTTWDFGELPERIEVTQIGGVPLYGWPSLDVSEAGVCLKLCKNRAEAIARSQRGFAGLCALALGDEMTWLHRELKALANLGDVYPGSPAELRDQAFRHLERYLFHREKILPLREQDFKVAIEQAQKLLLGIVPRFIGQIEGLLQTRRDILLSGLTYPEREADLERLLPEDFLSYVPHEQLNNLFRYLKAIRVRAERAKIDPRKDEQKAELIRVYQAQLDELETIDSSPERVALIDELRWMLEDYRVSIFAQELGTAQPVSPKRLDKKIEQIRQTR